MQTTWHSSQVHSRTSRRRLTGEGTGLKISTKKTKLMRINAKNVNAVVVDGQEIKDVDGFDYVGARLTKHRGAEDHIKSRSGKAAAAFNKLAKI